MSTGTIVRLLKKTKYSISRDDLKQRIDDFVESNKEYFIDNKCAKLPKFLYDVDSTEICNCIDKDTGIGYFIALEYNFNSCFHEVKNSLIDLYCGLNFVPNDTIVISQTEVEEMLFAVEYILLEKFDKHLERIMNNKFIEIFGALSSEYSYFKYKEQFPTDSETNPCDFEDFRKILSELRTIFSAYNYSENKDEYVLTFTFWN